MGGLVSGYTKEELAYSGPIIFEKDAVTTFVCHDVSSDQKSGDVLLKVKVLDGKNESKESEVLIQHSDVSFLRDVERQFAKTFFSEEELCQASGAPLQKLVSAKFQCRAFEPKAKRDGSYWPQVFGDFKYLGTADLGIPF